MCRVEAFKASTRLLSLLGVATAMTLRLGSMLMLGLGLLFAALKLS